ncbi:hypothetical protein VTO73DRAFT_7287 [Trametes versicolor]
MCLTDRLHTARRHPTYYLCDGNMVLWIPDGNVLYRLHRSILGLSSECFQTLLSLRPEDQGEGTHDAHPVVLPGIRAQDFDYFLDYHLRHLFPKHDENALVAVLNLGHFFQVEAAQTDARRALEQLPDFRAALKYRLGLKNMIVPWVSSGFRELVVKPLDGVAVEDIEAMGLTSLHPFNIHRFALRP